MAVDDKARMTELFRNKICPYCGEKIPEGSGVGAGSVAKGLFCSLDHYARYYGSEMSRANYRGTKDSKSE